MKVKIRVTSSYPDFDEDDIVEEKWIDAEAPDSAEREDIDEWAEEELFPETGTGRVAGNCRHCSEEIVMVNAAPDNEPERLRPFHKSEHDLPGYRSTCLLPEPLERTPDAWYTVEVLECDEFPPLAGRTFEWGG